MLVTARSISLRAVGILRPGMGGRVLASFERVCDLVTDAGEVVALVWGGIGNGPLNVVLPHGPGGSLPAGTRFAVTRAEDVARTVPMIMDRVSLATRSPVTIGAPHPGAKASAGQAVCGKGPAEASTPGNYLAISPVMIDLSAAELWNPQPDWLMLRARRQQVADGAKAIASILAESGWTLARCGLPEAVCESAARGQETARHALVGLGPGLTPAGDDWLAGWLLARYCGGDLRGLRNLEGLIAETAAARTTTLSRALLACAAAGEADASWHRLLSALAADPMTNLPIYQSTEAVLSHGATSGAAMLTGFCAGVAHLTPDA